MEAILQIMVIKNKRIKNRIKRKQVLIIQITKSITIKQYNKIQTITLNRDRNIQIFPALLYLSVTIHL